MSALRGYTQVYAKDRIFRVWLAWERECRAMSSDRWPETIEIIFSVGGVVAAGNVREHTVQ